MPVVEHYEEGNKKPCNGFKFKVKIIVDLNNYGLRVCDATVKYGEKIFSNKIETESKAYQYVPEGRKRKHL